MGGLAGIVHFTGDPPDARHLDRMSAAVAHRGPDDAGAWRGGPALLAHRRLVLTATGRRQPVVEGDLVLVLDGRLHDADALRRDVEAQGVIPATTGDADVALAAWRLWGRGALERLQGAFALAVWDRAARVLHLARDRAGIRPLFVARRPGRIAFASDIRALLVLPWVSREIAREHLAEYLAFRYTHAPRTLLCDVRQVPPASYARVDVDGARLERWWSPRWVAPGRPPPSREAVAEAIEPRLARAVRLSLQADRPVGLLLSGGAASTLLLALAADGTVPRTFNVSFADGGIDEASFAGRVARLFGTEHQTIRVGRADFVAALDEVTAAMGQPLPSPAAVIQHILCGRARGAVRVLITGDGSDELLAGARAAELVRELRLAALAGRLPDRARRAARKGIALLERLPGVELVGPTPGRAAWIGGSDVLGVRDRAALLRDPALVRPAMRRTVLETFYDEVRTDPINEVLHVYFRGWLPEDVLVRADRVAMARGIEVRFPYLADEVVAACTGWPGIVKLGRRRGRWYGKWPLRLLLAGKVPDEVLWRPKRGMPYPLGRWLRGEGEAFLWERVESVCADPAGLFQAGTIRRWASEHVRGRREYGPRLWTLFFLDAWLREVAGYHAPGEANPGIARRGVAEP